MTTHTLKIAALFFLLPYFVSGAELYVEGTPSSLRVGESMAATLFLDTQDQTINAIEGSLSYSPNIQVSQIYHGDSFLGFWIQSPEVRGDSIYYAGIVPGGYKGDISPSWEGIHPGKVFSVIFKAIAEGEGWVQVNRDSVVLLHNENASEAPLTVRDLVFVVDASSKVVGEDVIEWYDQIAPEPFVPVVIRNPDRRFGGKYYLVFQTTDKKSGVEYYEIKEDEGTFVRAQSPHLLERQKRDVEITVRAVDRAGNVREVVVKPSSEVVWYDGVMVRGMLVVLLLLIVSLLLVLPRLKKNAGKKK